MSPRYDAAVVGAGPSGAWTAALLARLGWQVLLLDKQPFPRDKPCGGGLTPRAMRELDIPIDGVVRAQINRVRLRGHSVAPFDLGSDLAAVTMVLRREFDRLLAEHARACGAELHDAEPLIGLIGPLVLGPSKEGLPSKNGDGLSLQTSRGSYQTRVLVGADGANGPVARMSGLRSQPHTSYILALEYEAPADGPFDRSAAFLDYRVPGGYGWVFPKGAWVNVGIGVTDRRRFGSARPYLDRFIADLPPLQLESAHLQGYRIPLGGPSQLVRGPVLLVGDAAGVADPFWGEGLAYALASARLAANAVDAYLRGSADDLQSYERAVKQRLRPHLRKLGLLSRVIYRFPDQALRFLRASSLAQRKALQALTGVRA